MAAPCGHGCAPAACARTPSSRRHRLSDSAYLALGLIAFIVGSLVQFGIYASVLQNPLRAGPAELARSALVRWIKLVAAWQVLVLLAAGAYVVLLASRHPSGPAWIAPPMGAVLGTALSLQFAVVALLRAARR